MARAPERLDLAAVRQALRTPKTPLRVLVLFAGAGGASWGLSRCPGLHVTAAVELDEAAARVHEANMPGHPVLRIDLNDPEAAARELAMRTGRMSTRRPGGTARRPRRRRRPRERRAWPSGSASEKTRFGTPRSGTVQ